MPEMNSKEPLWVQRMRARGYSIRRGTLDGPMSEIPEAMFTPPPRTARNLARTVVHALRSVIRVNPFSR